MADKQKSRSADGAFISFFGNTDAVQTVVGDASASGHHAVLPISALRGALKSRVSSLPATSAIALYAKPSPDFEEKLSQSRHFLEQAAHDFWPIVQASSLGAEDMVVTHLIHELGLNIPAFVLDTGKLFPQTIKLIERAQLRYGVKFITYHPEPASASRFEGRHGIDAMYKSVALRKECCFIRKMEPLDRALEGQRAWITGLRREQSQGRAKVEAIETSQGRTKFNPLVRWTWGDLWHFIDTHEVTTNSLHDQFFPSIGCAPCTRAVAVGEDFRAGRWWWEQSGAQECGLHVDAPSASLPPDGQMPGAELEAVHVDTTRMREDFSVSDFHTGDTLPPPLDDVPDKKKPPKLKPPHDLRRF